MEFFHLLIITQRRKKIILTLESSDNALITNDMNIKRKIQNYFHNIWNSTMPPLMGSLPYFNTNSTLSHNILDREIEEALWSLPSKWALRLDRLWISFYCSFWLIVRKGCNIYSFNFFHFSNMKGLWSIWTLFSS